SLRIAGEVRVDLRDVHRGLVFRREQAGRLYMKAAALDVSAKDTRRHGLPMGVAEERLLHGVDAVLHGKEASNVSAGEDERARLLRDGNCGWRLHGRDDTI